jgi:hypothetical protein
MSRRLQVQRKQKAPGDNQAATEIHPPFHARRRIDVKQPGSATLPAQQALYGSGHAHSNSVSDAEESAESSEHSISRKEEEKAPAEKTRKERVNKHA